MCCSPRVSSHDNSLAHRVGVRGPSSIDQGVIDDPCPHDVDWEQSQLPVAASEDDAGQPLGYLGLYLLGRTLSSIVLPAIERKSP
jgi:hypothetical protein